MGKPTVQTVMDWLNALAPFESAEDFDNVGLLMGDPSAEVSGVLFALDATCEAAREAISSGTQLLVTHHPLIFTPLRRIDYTSPQGRTFLALAEGRVNLIAVHTNWDKATGGVSDALANALELTDARRVDDYLRLGALPSPMDQNELLRFITDKLNVAPRMYGSANAPILQAAVAAGAYGEAAANAYLQGAQAYITGEIKHHELMDACARGLVVYEAGHYATEVPGIAALYQRFLSDAADAAWPIRARLFDNAPYEGATLRGR